MSWFLAITGWLAAFSLVRRSRKRAPCPDCAKWKNTAETRMRVLIGTQGWLDEERNLTAAKQKQIVDLVCKGEELAGQLADSELALKRVTAERDAAWSKIDRAGAELHPAGLSLAAVSNGTGG